MRERFTTLRGLGLESGAAGRVVLWTALGGAASLIVVVLIHPHLQPTASRIFLHLLYVYDLPVAEWGLLLLLPAILLAPALGWVSRMADICGRYPRRAALLVALALVIGTHLIYRAHPLSMDEYAVWFQSRIFAAGEITGRFPVEWIDRLLPLHFQNKFIVVSRESGAVASAYWPGFALLMAPFSALDVAWLCNPVLAALSLLVIGQVARLLFPECGVAGWAMLLTLASSAFLVMGISFYAMTVLMLGNLAFLYAFWEKTPRRLFAAGVIGSLTLVMHNPLPHLLFAAPWLLSWCWQRPPRRQFLALVAGYLPLSLFMGVGWWMLRSRLFANTDAVATGDVLVSVFTVPSIDVLCIRLAGMAKMWLWGVPGLLVLAIIGYCRYRDKQEVRLLAASAVLTVVGYLFVPFDQGHGWVYRYFYPAWAVLPILAGAAVAGPASGRESASERGGWTLATVTGALIALSLLVLVPLQLCQVKEFVTVQMAQVPRPGTVNQAQRTLVLLKPMEGFYLMDMVKNDPFLRSSEMRMVSMGPEQDARLLGDPRLLGELLVRTDHGEVRSRP